MNRRKVIFGVLSILAAAFLAAIIFFMWLSAVVFPQTMSAFAGLWNTTDALTLYVLKEKQWPDKWDDLKFVAPLYDEDDISFARDQVDVNFGIDISELPNDDEWYARVKSGRIEPEQQNANQRIRASIIALQKRSPAMIETEE